MDQLEPDEVAGEGDHEALVRDGGDDSRREAVDRGALQGGARGEEHRHGEGQLVEQHVRGRHQAGQVALDVEGGGGPEGGPEQDQEVAGQGLPRDPPPASEKEQGHSEEGQEEPSGLPGAQPVAGEKQVGPGGHEEGVGVEEHRGPGGEGEPEAEVDARELGPEEPADRQGVTAQTGSREHLLAAGEQPEPDEPAGHRRAQPRGEDRRDPAAAHLDGDHVRAPQQRQQQEQQNGAGGQGSLVRGAFHGELRSLQPRRSVPEVENDRARRRQGTRARRCGRVGRRRRLAPPAMEPPLTVNSRESR